MKTLQTYFWQLLSTLLAIAAIFASYNVFFLQKPEKGLQIVLSQPISLVDIKPEAESDIQVLYKNQPISSLYLYQLQIVNSGNQPILKDDFESSLSFTFPDGVYIADDPISKSEPPNIGLTVHFVAESYAVAKDALLNPGDTVSVRFILVGNSDKISENMVKVDGRIVGVKEIKTVTSNKQEIPVIVIGFLSSLAAGIIMTVIQYSWENITKRFSKRKAG